MDPKETLIQADQAISDMRLADALVLLDAYYAWRLRGGFEPYATEPASGLRGDKFASYCTLRIADRTR